MWNCHWQDSIDYGEKYNWGLIETHKKIMAQWRDCKEQDVLRVPIDGYIGSILDRYRNMARELPEKTMLIQQEQWLRQQGRAIRGCGETGIWQLTRGGIAVAWVLSQATVGATVVLVGFDIIRAGVALPVEAAFSPKYQASPGFWGIDGYTPGATKEGNHDYVAERRLLELIAAHKGGVRLVFAEDEWPCHPE